MCKKSLTINIYYTGVNGSARRFVNEMIINGMVERIRNEDNEIINEKAMEHAKRLIEMIEKI